MGKHRKHLTDDELTIILESSTLTVAALAQQLGNPRNTTGYAMARLRAGKWVCAVRFEPCKRCGQTVTIRGSHNSQFYHAECARENQRDAQNQLVRSQPETIQTSAKSDDTTANQSDGLQSAISLDG